MIHLAKIERLDLLREFFEVVYVPPAVWHEAVEAGRNYPETRLIEQAQLAGWLVRHRVRRTPLLRLLEQSLDKGEAEAIALALQERVEMVLLDETEARTVAAQLGLSRTGVVGILIRAKQKGIIRSLRMELNRLQTQGGFWLSEQVFRAAIEAVGESDDAD